MASILGNQTKHKKYGKEENIIYQFRSIWLGRSSLRSGK